MEGEWPLSSITKRPNGQWRARYRDTAGKEHARHFSRKIDGQKWLDEVTASVVTGAYVDPASGRVTFEVYFARWSDRQIWAPTTATAMALAGRSVTFSRVRMTDLRPSHLETWVKTMTAAGLAPGTVRTRVNNVRASLRAAVRDRVIARDPSEGLTLPRVRRPEAAMALPSNDQVLSLLRASDDRFGAFVALAAFAGLRLGEIAGLQVGDIDFLRRQLHVRRQVQRLAGGEVDVRLPKYGSERIVFLADDLTELLAKHIRSHSPGTDANRWLFSSLGTPPHQNTVGHQWRMAARRAGVPDLTLHGLRHFYASGLIAAGCDVVTVQRALGHARASTTLNTYGHLWPTAEDRTRKAAGDLMLAVGSAPAESESGSRADSSRTV